MNPMCTHGERHLTCCDEHAVTTPKQLNRPLWIWHEAFIGWRQHAFSPQADAADQRIRSQSRVHALSTNVAENSSPHAILAKPECACGEI